MKTDLEIRPVLVVYGSERGLVEQAVRHVRAKVVQGAMADFNHDRLSAKTASVEQVLGCCRTLPVMAPLRLVELSDGDAFNAEALLKIADYAAAPSPEAVLLIVAGKIDKRTKAAKALDAQGCLQGYEPLTEDEAIPYAQRRAKDHGLTLEREAAIELVAAVGSDLQLIERALEKLELVCTDQTVHAEQVETHISQTRVESVFALTDAIAAGDQGQALTVLGQMLDAREAPLRILSTMLWHQRQVVRARALLDRGLASGEVMGQINIRNRDRFLQQVRAIPAQRAAQGLAAIARTDRQLKSSRMPARAVMERVVLELAALR
ncbi:MAG: DNA polymerase III subunit delta [Pseudomonadota bacterium]